MAGDGPRGVPNLIQANDWMVFDQYILIQQLLACILVGYLLGSVPFARLAARWKGVDIFATGSQKAGSANVFWNIGRRTGMLVFAGDVAKGSLAIIIARLLDVPDPLALLAGAAAVIGHWNSIFTGFRGGDGMATLIGAAITLVPSIAVLSVAVGLVMLVILRRHPFRSGWGLLVCSAMMLAISQYYQTDRDLVLGVVLLAILVLGHSLLARRRHPPETDQQGAELSLPVNPDSDPDSVGAAPGNR